MGPASWIFPSASHSMFEHSIGAAILAQTWCLSLRARFPFRVSPVDVVTVTVAALLKNIGCMPWESAFRAFMHERGDRSQMEHSSVKIVSHMLARLEDVCRDAKVNPAFVQDLIVGSDNAPPDWGWCDEGNQRLFLFDLVNTPHGCNAVSLDNLLRCNARLGLRAGVELQRVIDNSWIGDSTHLLIHAVILTDVTTLENHINEIVVCNTEVASIEVAILSVWNHSDWIHKVSDDLSMLLRLTDLTFKSDTEFMFFHADMLAQNLPKMLLEREFVDRAGADAYMHAHPLSGSLYHVTVVKKFACCTYIVRVFYLP